MKALIKSALQYTPYTVRRRTDLNRFQATVEALAALKARGFSPTRVLDAGANIGGFTEEMLALFPRTTVHAIEPQPGCRPILDAIANKWHDRVVVHEVALGSPETEGCMLSLATDETERSTGAHVISGSSAEHMVSVQSITLDSLTAGFRSEDGPWLLKMDLQGYELLALRGAAKTLALCDVLLTEVSFYAQDYEPRISALVEFLAEHGFEIYDIASLYARPRDNRPRQGDFILVRWDGPMAADTSWS